MNLSSRDTKDNTKIDSRRLFHRSVEQMAEALLPLQQISSSDASAAARVTRRRGQQAYSIIRMTSPCNIDTEQDRRSNLIALLDEALEILNSDPSDSDDEITTTRPACISSSDLLQ